LSGALIDNKKRDGADRGLDLLGGDGWLLVVVDAIGRLADELLKDVVDERVHYGHGLRLARDGDVKGGPA
jgi:hypothetical protein